MTERVAERERQRLRETETNRQADRERETDRQTDRQRQRKEEVSFLHALPADVPQIIRSLT